jgi:predicted transcriptional regulator
MANATKTSDNFRTNLRAIMEEKEVSQRMLAKAADISLSHLHSILMGHVCPALDLAARLSHCMATNLEDLIRTPEQRCNSKRFEVYSRTS